MSVQAIHLYILHNSANGKCYVGQTMNMASRYKQHSSKPPTRMQGDVQQFQPFKSFFHMTELDCTNDPFEANRLESHYIRLHNATGPRGYNNLSSKPGSSKKFWFLKNKRLI